MSKTAKADKDKKSEKKDNKKNKHNSSKKRKREKVPATPTKTSIISTPPTLLENCVLPLLHPCLDPTTKSEASSWLLRVPSDETYFPLEEVVQFVESLKPEDFKTKMARTGSLLGFRNLPGGDKRMELRMGNLVEGGNVMRVLIPKSSSAASNQQQKRSSSEIFPNDIGSSSEAEAEAEAEADEDSNSNSNNQMILGRSFDHQVYICLADQEDSESDNENSGET